MKKLIKFREVIEKTVEFEGTEDEIAEQISEYRDDPELLQIDKNFDNYYMETLDDVDEWMQQFNVVWNREDLETVMENYGIEVTEENIWKIIEYPVHHRHTDNMIEDGYAAIGWVVEERCIRNEH